MKICVLEDHVQLAEMIQTTLQLAGHQVQIYNDGHTLLTRLRKAQDDGAPMPYDLALIDLRLKGDLSGRDVIVRIRQLPGSRALPIIMMSAADFPTLIHAAMDLQNVTILSKPFKPDTLIRLVEVMSNQREQETQPHEQTAENPHKCNELLTQQQ